MNAETLTLFELAMRGRDPLSDLRMLALRLRDGGKGPGEVYGLFEEYMLRLRSEGCEFAEEAIMDVMDCIVGYCSPQAKIFPKS